MTIPRKWYSQILTGRWSVQELVEEDEGDGDGCEPADDEEEAVEKPGGQAQGVVVRQFLDDQGLGQTPADKEAKDDAAEGHNPLGGEGIEGVEEAKAEEGTEIRKGAEAEATEGAENHADARHADGGLPTAEAKTVHEEGGDFLVHGDGAGECRQDE